MSDSSQMSTVRLMWSCLKVRLNQCFTYTKIRFNNLYTDLRISLKRREINRKNDTEDKSKEVETEGRTPPWLSESHWDKGSVQTIEEPEL